MSLASYCITITIMVAALLFTADRARADQVNMVQCPHFAATTHWDMGNGKGNTYLLALTNDKTSCSDATSWAKKLMKGSFSGVIPVPVKGPAGYSCHVMPDGKGGVAGGTCHKSDNVTGWDWIAADSG